MNKLKRFPIILPDGTIEIPLTKGYVTYIDSVDSDLADVMWHVLYQKPPYTKYAKRTINHSDGNTDYLLLHRAIAERMLGRSLNKDERVDHKDSNGLNNRRSNLRISTLSQNMANQPTPRSNTSRYKGVTYVGSNKWRAQITHNRQVVYLGTFDSPGEAHEAYKTAALKYYGEFARFD